MNRREHKRFSVRDVDGRMLFASEVIVINLSEGGGLIEVDKRLDIGREYTLKIGDEDWAVQVRALIVASSIVRSKRLPKGDIVPIYRAGLKFKEVLNQSPEEFRRFIENHEHEMAQEGEELHVKVPDAKLHDELDYKVTTLSQGGLEMQGHIPQEVGSTVPLEIVIDEVSMRLHGTVTSCNPPVPGVGGGFSIGVSFARISKEQDEFLAEYLKSLEEEG